MGHSSLLKSQPNHSPPTKSSPMKINIDSTTWITRFLALTQQEKSLLGYTHEKTHSVSGHLMSISEDYTRGVYSARREESPEGMD